MLTQPPEPWPLDRVLFCHVAARRVSLVIIAALSVWPSGVVIQKSRRAHDEFRCRA